MNLEDIAKLAGVSRSTVSRVINNDPNVSKTARAKVQATIDKVGYRPHAAARALASHRSHAIGLVVPEDFSQYHVDSWYPLIIEATLAATKKTNQILVLIMEDTFAPDAGNRVITQFIDSGRVDGLLILMHSYKEVPDYLTQQLMDRDVPFVLVAESDIPGTSWVDNDNFRGGQRAAQAAAAQGARSLAVMAATNDHVPTRRRIEGALSVFPEAAVAYTDHSHQEAGTTAQTVLRVNPPDAIFAANGWIAPSVHLAASHLNIAIPDELMLIAYDDFDLAFNEAHGLTSVVQPVTLLADRAVNLLIDRVEGRAPAGEHIVLDPVLIPRGSCNDRVADPVQGGVATV